MCIVLFVCVGSHCSGCFQLIDQMASLVSKVKGAVMGLTIRKLLIGVAVLFGLKIVWHFLHPTPINKPNLQEMADTPDYLLKQHGCTNGTHKQ